MKTTSKNFKTWAHEAIGEGQDHINRLTNRHQNTRNPGRKRWLKLELHKAVMAQNLILQKLHLQPLESMKDSEIENTMRNEIKLDIKAQHQGDSGFEELSNLALDSSIKKR